MSESKERLLPGTITAYTDSEVKAFSQIELLISAAGGLSLSQVCAITGLEGSTIQNWVKRGWVSNPKGKKYNEVQIARILIINALKECIKLESIAQLMSYVNGSTEDISDDIISESELFNYLCDALRELEHSDDFSRNGVETVVENIIKDYQGPAPDSRIRLRKALAIMLYACVCSDVKRRTEVMLAEILPEKGAEEQVNFTGRAGASSQETGGAENAGGGESLKEDRTEVSVKDDEEEINQESVQIREPAAVQTTRSWFFKKGS